MQLAHEQDKRIPTELHREKKQVEHDLSLADKKTIIARSVVDDEYEDAKYRDPKLLITTSRGASQRLLSFQKELKLILPNSLRINRGGYVIKDLVSIC